MLSPTSLVDSQQDTPPLDQQTQEDNNQQDDEPQDMAVEFPSSEHNARSYKKPPKKIGQRGKFKGRSRLENIEGNRCPLLDLPEDVLHHLLCRLPPRSLLQLGATCKLLQLETKAESVWRQSYINHYMWDGAASSGAAREQVKALVQGCTGVGGRGWKREALSRENMLEHWVYSRISNVVHQPLTVLIHSMSLSYPQATPGPRGGPLVVGKMTQSPNGSGSSTPSKASPAGKTSAKQRYEAKHAVSSRPPPTLYCAGMDVGALVKSDPLTGRVTKGFWGPGQDANFHLRPHWDPSSAPSAIFIPKRSQTHMLWGLMTGSTVHTTLQTRSHQTHGNRAHSVNVYSKPNDMHVGAVLSISQPESSGSDPLKWVTGGEDGRVKYWQLNPGPSSRSGKKTPTDAQPASISCLFTSGQVETPFSNRPEEVALRQIAVPDGIIRVACDINRDIVCGVTIDGDLRVWFDAATEPHEVRVDTGSADEFGGVRDLQMVCRELKGTTVATILVHHLKHPNIARYDVSFDESGEQVVNTVFYGTQGDMPLTAVAGFLSPSPPIAEPPAARLTTLSARIVTPSSASGANTPAPAASEGDQGLDSHIETLPQRLAPPPEYGRIIVAGDAHGQAYIWPLDGGDVVGGLVQPIREWYAMEGKITSMDYSCGLVAFGAYSGHVDVFDPLPFTPTRLRSFRPPGHLTPGDLMLAESEQPRGRFFNCNHIILENDLITAALGRSVLTWRAGSSKGRQSGKEGNTSRKSGGGGGGKGEFRGHSRALDLRDLHQDAVDSHFEIQEENEAARVQTFSEREHMAAMEELGLDDGDAALQYALMISQQEAEDAARTASEAGALEATDAEWAYSSHQPTTSVASPGPFESEDPDDLAEILEQIRLAEERERQQSGL